MEDRRPHDAGNKSAALDSRAPGDTRPADSPPARAQSHAPVDPLDPAQDDDIVPPECFWPDSLWDHENATTAAPVHQLSAEDVDFIPPGIFEAVAASNGEKAPPPQLVVPQDSPVLVEASAPSGSAGVVSVDTRLPVSEVTDVVRHHRGEGGAAHARSTLSSAPPDRDLSFERPPSAAPNVAPQVSPSGTFAWPKPFPMAPPIPPLPSAVTTRPVAKPIPDPKPAVVAAAPPPTASPATIPMTRTVTQQMPPPAGMTYPSFGVDQLLRLASSLGASTLYLSSNTRPSVRVDGAVQLLEGMAVLRPNEIESLLISLALAHTSAEHGALAVSEWSFDMPAVGRVRCMTFRDGRGPGAVFRIVPAHAAVDEQPGLSLEIQALAVEREGLVIVAGPRASGKHAVMGALVDLINRTRRHYVITVQREVNLLPEGEGSLISRREARGGLDDMLAVARAALQENPDVLVLQEVRSAPLMNLALDAAASGQLVIAGFTAPNASRAIQCIVDLYPPEQARLVQTSLAQHLRAVVGQVLVPKIGGGRVAAHEMLLNTAAVSSVLAAGNPAHLSAAKKAQRMVPLSDVLVELVRNGVVAAGEAYRHAADPIGFIDALKQQGMDTSIAHRPA